LEQNAGLELQLTRRRGKRRERIEHATPVIDLDFSRF
jgi:hypothetical protein